MAVFEVAHDWGSLGMAVRDYVASCGTLRPPNRVLAGNTYNVQYYYTNLAVNQFIKYVYYSLACIWM